MPIIWFIVWLIIFYNLYLMFFVYLPVIVGCIIIIVVVNLAAFISKMHKKAAGITWEDEHYTDDMNILYDKQFTYAEKLEMYTTEDKASYAGQAWAKKKLSALRGEQAAS